MNILNRARGLSTITLASILTVVSLICMQPEIYTVLIWVTLGIALALVVVPNICAVLWAKVATEFLFPEKSSTAQWCLVTLIIAALALGPAFLSKIHSDNIMSQYAKNTISGATPKKPAHIKFLYEGPTAGSFPDSCNYVCQDLFLTGTVKSLTFENRLTKRSSRQNKTSKTYTLKSGRACQVNNGEGSISFKSTDRQAMLDLIAEGKCVLASKTASSPFDVIVRQTMMSKSELGKVNNETARLFVEYDRIATRSIENRSEQVLISESDVVLQRLFLPNVFGYVGEHDRIALGLMKTKDKSIDSSLKLWGLQKLYPNVPVQREHRNSRARPKTVPRNQKVDNAISRANKVLDDAPARTVINKSQLSIVSSGLVQKTHNLDRRKYESDGDPAIDLALRILADQRVQDESLLTKAVYFLNRPTVSYEGDLDAEIFKRLSNAKGKQKAVTLKILSLRPQAVRRAKATLIMRDLRQQSPEDIKGSFAYAGQLGVSPVQLYKKAVNEHKDWTTLLPVAKAISCVDPQWRKPLIPVLDKMIAQHARGEGSRHAAGTAVWTLNKVWKTPTALSKKHRSFASSATSPARCR